MKNIRILLLLLPLLLFWGCEDREGYLDALHARYIPDIMTVKSVLRPEENADDARRVKFRIPWQSPVLQGVEGTNPRSYRIYMVETENGEAGEAAAQQFGLGVSGIIELAWDHTVPPGCYRIGLEISNAGGKNKYCFPGIFTVIVEP